RVPRPHRVRLEHTERARRPGAHSGRPPPRGARRRLERARRLRRGGSARARGALRRARRALRLSWLAGLWTSPAPRWKRIPTGPPTQVRSLRRSAPTAPIPPRGGGALSTKGIATRCLVSGSRAAPEAPPGG